MLRGPEGASVHAGKRSAEWCERSLRPFPAPVGLPHCTTLQHHRRPNVTATVTSILFWTEQGRTSRIHAATIRRCMLVFAQQSAAFSRGCAHPSPRPRISATHPHHRAIRKSLFANTPSPVILATADSYSLPHYLVARHESEGENRPFPNPY